MRGALLPYVEANTYPSRVTALVTTVGMHGDPDGKGAQGGAGHRLPGLGGCCCLEPPTLFVDSLACLKTCVSPTAGSARPSVEQFHKYLPWFLSDEPNIKCPKG